MLISDWTANFTYQDLVWWCCEMAQSRKREDQQVSRRNLRGYSARRSTMFGVAIHATVKVAKIANLCLKHNGRPFRISFTTTTNGKRCKTGQNSLFRRRRHLRFRITSSAHSCHLRFRVFCVKHLNWKHEAPK